LGLDIGADDYLGKPFEVKELIVEFDESGVKPRVEVKELTAVFDESDLELAESVVLVCVVGVGSGPSHHSSWKMIR